MKICFLILSIFLLSQQALFSSEIEWPSLINDSNTVNKYSKVDSELIRGAQKDFRDAKNDTSRFIAIYSVVENLISNDWEYLNDWLLKQMEIRISQEGLSEEELEVYKNLYASTLGNKGLILNERGDYEEALNYLNLAHKLNHELGNKKNIASDLGNIGYTHSKKGDALLALDYYKKALAIHEKTGDKLNTALLLNNIGFIYQRIGDLVKCIDYYEQALKIREEVEDISGIANSFHNLAAIHLDQGDKEKALEYYQKALKICEEIGDKRGLALTLNDLGYLYEDDGETERAKELYNEAFEIYKDLGDRSGQVLCMHNLGNICIVEENWDCANAILDSAWQLNEELGDDFSKPGLLHLMANVNLKQGKLKLAEEKALRAMEISEKNHFSSNIKQSALILENIYKEMGNWEKRFKYSVIYFQYKDSLLNDETRTAALNQSLKYDYEKKLALDNAKNEIKIAIEKEKQKKQFVILVIIIIAALLVLVLLFIIYRRLKVTRNQKKLIEEQKQIVDKAYDALGEAHKEITDSIAYAKRIQNAILPPQKLVKDYLPESFILYKPKDVVAGDFYWVEKIDGKILFAAADCTGHGVPGALVSVICNNGLNRSVREFGLSNPGKILDKTRELVISEFEKSEDDVQDGMDIALCALENNKLQYAGAHNPLWIIRNGEVLEIKADKQPIGKYELQKPYTSHTIDLLKGDSIYLFSDGYVDQFGGQKGKKFMAKPFKKLLIEIQTKTIEEQKKIIDKTFEDWKGEESQVDDVCVFGIRV